MAVRDDTDTVGGRSAASRLAQVIATRSGKRSWHHDLPTRLDDPTGEILARRTANVILGNAFGVPGITVDTHFQRLVRRFGWTTETDPVKIEFAVGDLIPKKDWTMLSHHLIWHGRRVCHARNPACGACTVARWCPSYGEGPTDPEKAAKLVKTEGRA